MSLGRRCWGGERLAKAKERKSLKSWGQDKYEERLTHQKESKEGVGTKEDRNCSP